MKIAAFLLTIACVALAASALALPDLSTVLIGSAVGCGAIALIAQLAGLKATPAGAHPTVAVATQASATETVAPQQAEAEVIAFLAALQEKGRLVDFLMDDVTGYEDAQVGAAARVGHEGCRAALDEVFTIVPVTESAEGTTISVPESHRADEYRLTGKLTGQAPFNGTIVHRGWKTAKTKLPQIFVPGGELPCISPAEIELS